MELNREKGEFNFNMHESNHDKIQYQARYQGEESELIFGLAYDIVFINKRKRKNANYFENKIRALAVTSNTKSPSLGENG